jgi:hypothetical protein
MIFHRWEYILTLSNFLNSKLYYFIYLNPIIPTKSPKLFITLNFIPSFPHQII